jgi:dipeptidyl aminopeptidase/acylaminoacyl peptidase
LSDNVIDRLLAIPGLATPAVSPDGEWVAWSWYRTAPAAEVYAAPVDGSYPPVRLTDTADDSGLVSWTPDSTGLIVEQDHDGDERGTLYRVDLERPLQMVRLTEEQPEYFVRGGQLHPNGRWLVYGANFDYQTGREIEPTCVWRQDLKTGERRLLARPEKGGMASPQLNFEGTHVLYTRMDLHPSGRQIWLADIYGTEDREIINLGADVKVSASWFPDSRRVLVVADAGRYRRVGVWSFDQPEVRWVLDDPSRTIERGFVPLGSEWAVVMEVRDARPRPSLLDTETGREHPLPAVAGNLAPVAPAADGFWIGQFYSGRDPADLVRFDWSRPAETLSSVTRLSTTYSIPQHLAPAEEFDWKSVDGLPIRGWLYRAPGEALGTIVYVHGGPTAHSEDRLNIQIQYFVSQGFNVLDPNYRGSTGYGVTFRESIKEDGWGGREQEDIRTGIEALIAAGIARPGKVGITGTSYGGYSSWCAITRHGTDLVAAAAPICGMTDLVMDYDATRPDIRPYTEEMMGGRPDEQVERYRERSPLSFVASIRGKLLIVQGMKDPNVPPEHVRVVLPALEAAGIPYELLQFEDEGHGIKRPENQKRLYVRLAEFFRDAFGASRK